MAVTAPPERIPPPRALPSRNGANFAVDNYCNTPLRSKWDFECYGLIASVDTFYFRWAHPFPIRSKLQGDYNISPRSLRAEPTSSLRTSRRARLPDNAVPTIPSGGG